MGTINQSSFRSFRQQAEEILKAQLSTNEHPKTLEEMQRLLYEIQLNKIELELWNSEHILSGNQGSCE